MSVTSVSIVIATLNRREDLRATMHELQKLNPAPLEILVCLDGSTDGSREMLHEFDNVRVIENEEPSGSVFSRDRLFRMASGDLIVSLDDDSAPMQVDFVSRVIELANNHPEAGVFAFREIRPAGRDDRPFGAPESKGYIASYPNCAGAVRASLYGDVASYPTLFFHMYEEPDFCLQSYATGYGVLFEPSIKVLHRYTSVGRNLIRRHHQHARNEALSIIMRCPMPHLPWVLAYRGIRQLAYAVSNGPSWVIREPQWWWRFLSQFHIAWQQRRPVDWKTYWAWIRLARNPLPPEEEVLFASFPVVASRLSRS
ncbi:MAG: glycosyltransferase [Pseudomonadota bacterium]